MNTLAFSEGLGVMGRMSHEERMKIWAWEDFHKDVLKRGKSIDLVIEVMQDTINSITNKGVDKKYIDINLDCLKTGVTKSEISSKLLDFYMDKVYESGIPIEEVHERNIFGWNMALNLLRGTNYYKENASFLRPHDEQILARDFIERLGTPPEEPTPFRRY